MDKDAEIEELKADIRWYVDLVGGCEGTDFLSISHLGYSDMESATRILTIIGAAPEDIQNLRDDLEKIETKRRKLRREMSLVEK